MTKSSNLTFRYSLNQVLYWFVVCGIISFGAAYLTERGFALSTVGIILFSANMVSFFAQLFLADIADKAANSRSLKTLMVVLAVITFSLLAIIRFVDLPMTLAAILYVPLVACFDMEIPLMNSVTVFYTSRDYKLSYGISRCVAAISFGLSSLGMGYAIKAFTANIMPILAMLATLGFIAIVLSYPEEKAAIVNGHESGAASLSIGQFISKYKLYVISLGGLLMFGAAHLAFENYLIEVVRPLGGDSSNVGIILLVATAIEAPAMLISPKAYKKLGAHRMWIIIGISYTLRFFLVVIAKSLSMIYIAQLLQISSYGFLPPLQIYYSNDCVDDADMVKGQSTSTAMYSLGNAMGNLFGGLIVSAAGVAAMLKSCVAAAFVGLLIVAIFVPKAMKGRKVDRVDLV